MRTPGLLRRKLITRDPVSDELSLRSAIKTGYHIGDKRSTLTNDLLIKYIVFPKFNKQEAPVYAIKHVFPSN